MFHKLKKTRRQKLIQWHVGDGGEIQNLSKPTNYLYQHLYRPKRSEIFLNEMENSHLFAWRTDKYRYVDLFLQTFLRSWVREGCSWAARCGPELWSVNRKCFKGEEDVGDIYNFVRIITDYNQFGGINDLILRYLFYHFHLDSLSISLFLIQKVFRLFQRVFQFFLQKVLKVLGQVFITST